jgi:hypothetical protein
LTVSSLADSGPGTLRAAILAADAGSHSDKFTIGFSVTGTIALQTPGSREGRQACGAAHQVC